jgi:hypothetical protein
MYHQLRSKKNRKNQKQSYSKYSMVSLHPSGGAPCDFTAAAGNGKISL